MGTNHVIFERQAKVPFSEETMVNWKTQHFCRCKFAG